jgi:hypothetical protein
VGSRKHINCPTACMCFHSPPTGFSTIPNYHKQKQFLKFKNYPGTKPHLHECTQEKDCISVLKEERLASNEVNEDKASLR